MRALTRVAAQGKVEEAERLYRTVIERLGEDHPNFAAVLNNMASLKQRQACAHAHCLCDGDACVNRDYDAIPPRTVEMRHTWLQVVIARS